jgi:N-acetyl sugar amidotransferase
MIYCKNCLQPDTRPNIVFSESGICPACVYYEKLKNVDWQEREVILFDLIKSIPKNRKNRFNCIIGVSGGKDSTRQALFVREKLKINPLLVCITYPPQQVTERGTNNISNLINLGFDCVIVSPSPNIWRDLMRHGFDKFVNWQKSTELALFSCVPRQAIYYDIPLILWGENPGLQLGDLNTLGINGYDGNNLRNSNTLAGGAIDWLLEKYDITNILPYCYPSREEFTKHNIQIVYLGWFLRDWSLITNGAYSCLNGLQIRNNSVIDTGDLYGISSLDEDWVTLNQMIKYYKFGFGKVTEYINEEIRLGRISREDGIEIVNKYDHCCSNKYIESFCQFIDISVDYFWEKVRNSANKDLFTITNDGKIIKKFKVGVGIENE